MDFALSVFNRVGGVEVIASPGERRESTCVFGVSLEALIHFRKPTCIFEDLGLVEFLAELPTLLFF